MALSGALSPAALAQAVALSGADRVDLELPATALVEPYANAGYRLRVEGGTARVEVSLTPLRSGDPFQVPGPAVAETPVGQVARAVTTGAASRYAAVSRVLDWVARNITYELDRHAAQDAASVLASRRGYCTGIARLTVALLAAVEIPAREVPGFVLAPPAAGIPAGFHRWVEVRYEDVGWVFSDSLTTHHYVPATYVRLASEALLPEPEQAPGRLLRREDSRQPVDLVPELVAGLTVRRNDARQRAAALRVSVDRGASGRVVLEGEGQRRSRELLDGVSTFLGLPPGSYLLRVEVDGASPMRKRVVLRDRVLASVHLPAGRSAPAEAPEPIPALPKSRFEKENST